MNIPASKESILRKIREALIQSTPLPFPQSEGNSSVFEPSKQEMELDFAEHFTRLQGKFIFCADESELVLKLSELVNRFEWKNLYCSDMGIRKILQSNQFTPNFSGNLSACDISITGCEYLVARTGSMVLSSAQHTGRTSSVYAPIHVCIAYMGQLVYDLKDALKMMKEKYPAGLPSLISFATGPSRTADIEKTLVVGVHGPREVYCFLVDKQAPNT